MSACPGTVAAVAWMPVGRLAACPVITRRKWLPTGSSTETHQSLNCATLQKFSPSSAVLEQIIDECCEVVAPTIAGFRIYTRHHSATRIDSQSRALTGSPKGWNRRSAAGAPGAVKRQVLPHSGPNPARLYGIGISR
jgi:hypothetical protein